MEKIRSHLFFALLLILPVFLNDCKNDDSNGKETEITGKIWKLEYIENTTSHFLLFFPDIPEKITIEFAAGKQLLFEGICNHGTGSYAIENEKLTISSLMITKIFCDNSHWETVAVSNLLQASSAELMEGKLIISSKGDFNLIFK